MMTLLSKICSFLYPKNFRFDRVMNLKVLPAHVISGFFLVVAMNSVKGICVVKP